MTVSASRVSSRAPPCSIGSRPGQIDAAVLPSDREGIPVALIEALAYCVPAIATDVGGIAELLGDGCGELVPRDDADALAAAIARVLRTPELRECIVGAGRARIEREFAARVGRTAPAGAIRVRRRWRIGRSGRTSASRS